MAWYECKVTHKVISEDGWKTVTEPYLVEALSVTEAATRITAKLDGDGGDVRPGEQPCNGITRRLPRGRARADLFTTNDTFQKGNSR